MFAEYARDIMKIASREGLKNMFASNGFMSESLAKSMRHLDAINIDLKGWKKTYESVGGRIEPVLRNIRLFHERGVWVEATTLLVTGMNTSKGELDKVADALSSISTNIPWHVTRYYPSYMHHSQPTSSKTISTAIEIGKKHGLKFIYAGNLVDEKNSTRCPKCGNVLIERRGFEIISNKITNGKCPWCSEVIPGVWN